MKYDKEKNVVEFTLDDLLPIGMTFVTLSIGLGFGAIVLGDMKSDVTGITAADNQTKQVLGNGSAAVLKISAKQGILATVAVAAVIIGILFTYFMFRK